MIHESIWLPVTGALAGWLMGAALNRLVRGFLVEYSGMDAFPLAGGAPEENILNFRNLLLFGALPAFTAFLTAWRTWSPELLDDLILTGSLFALAIIDWKSQLIDSRLVVVALVLRGAWLAVFKPDLLPESLLGLLIGAGLLYLIGFLYEALRKRQGLGEGDPALLGLVGFWVGWTGLGPVLLIAAVSGILIGGFMLWRRKLPLFHSPVPFGPFICLGGLLVHLLQQSGWMSRSLEFLAF